MAVAQRATMYPAGLRKIRETHPEVRRENSRGKPGAKHPNQHPHDKNQPAAGL